MGGAPSSLTSGEPFAKAFRSSPVPLCLTTIDDGVVLDANDAYVELIGYEKDEVIGRNRTELGAWFDPEERARFLGEIGAHGAVRNFQARLRRKSGEILDVIVSSEKVDGATPCMLSVALDVTERRRLRKTEDQLRQVQKMEAIGGLAAGIAHDFNNILSVVLGYAEVLLHELAQDDPIRSDVEDIRDAGLRATELTRQLLAFSRRQLLEPKVVEVNALVANLEKMLQRLVTEQVQITMLFGPDAGRVLVDPGQLEQVVLNLVGNARDAMPSGGALTVATKPVVLDEVYAREHVGVVPGPYTLVSVSDEGDGMDDATRERMFEPFFTTKASGKGTGLGLATVLGIVQQSHGHITVESEIGKGTTVNVLLPRTDRPAATDDAPTSTGSFQGNETILVVEDEEPVRRIVRDLLRRHGYEVHEAANAGEALLAFEAHSDRIHLLLTDVVMPRVSGPALAERLCAMRPDVRILYMSGYANDTPPRREQGMPFLQKPIRPRTLLKKVREVLDQHAAVLPRDATL